MIIFTLPSLIGESDREQIETELIEAISTIKPNQYRPLLAIECRQPIYGRIANTIIRVCQLGVTHCRLTHNNEDYLYTKGKVIEQTTILVRKENGLLLHNLVLLFADLTIVNNRCPPTITNSRSTPRLSLVSSQTPSPIGAKPVNPSDGKNSSD